MFVSVWMWPDEKPVVNFRIHNAILNSAGQFAL